LKSNHLTYNTTQVKSIGTFREHEELVNINLISDYKPIVIAGWHSETSIKIFLFNLSIDIINGYHILLGWKTFDGSEVTDNIVTVNILHVRNK
jgi:lysophospholipid acyltransferase (LPLAT)-like uncharacterized protein